jgi:hypothetical protein
MKKVILLATLLLFSITWVGCNDNDDDPKPVTAKTTLSMSFKTTAAGNVININDTFPDFLGRSTALQTFKYYLSNIQLLDANQNSHLFKNVLLVDYNNHSTTFSAEVPAGNYQQIKIGIGLDAEQNASDPANFENTHPLATSQNTYWSWAAKYKFIQIDGKTDLNGDGSLEQLFGYHTGLDTMYATTTIDHAFEVKAQQNTHLSFRLDMNEVFSKNDTVDCAIEPSWHGNTATASIAFRLTTNFVSSLKIEP